MAPSAKLPTVPARGREFLGGSSQSAIGEPQGRVNGEVAGATGRAVVVGAILEFDVAHQAHEGLVAAVLELARALAGRATQTGPLVPPFFRSLRAVSMALAPMVWTRSRDLELGLAEELVVGLGGEQLGDPPEFVLGGLAQGSRRFGGLRRAVQG